MEIRTYEQIELNRLEVLRYMGVKLPQGDQACAMSNLEMLKLLNECVDEVLPFLTYRVCYTELSYEDIVNSEYFNLPYLKDVRSAVLFGATVGINMDRLISKYGNISPSKAVIIDAIGSERIESLCDKFSAEVGDLASLAGLNTLPRISPGYGTFKLEAQKEIFARLDLQKTLGLTLNDSFLMSPTKSVTAIIGITEETEACSDEKCKSCTLGSCSFRA